MSRYHLEQYTRGPIKVVGIVETETGRLVQEFAGRSSSEQLKRAREEMERMEAAR